MTEPRYQGWALVEIMGHRTLIGQVVEVEMLGTKMLRITIPDPDPDSNATADQYYSGGSIFSMTPLTPEQAAERIERERAWRSPAALTAGVDDDGPNAEFEDSDDAGHYGFDND